MFFRADQIWAAGLVCLSFCIAVAPGCGCPKSPPQEPTEVSPPEADESQEDLPPAEESEPKAEEKSESEAEQQSEESKSEQSGGEGSVESDKEGESADGSPESGTESSSKTSDTAMPPTEESSAGSTATEGEADGSTKTSGSPLGNPKKSPPAPLPKGDPKVAQREGREQLAAANKSAKQGHDAEAFKHALLGWQAVAPHTNDAECRRLAALLRKQLEQTGAAANRGVSTDSSKTQAVE